MRFVTPEPMRLKFIPGNAAVTMRPIVGKGSQGDKGDRGDVGPAGGPIPAGGTPGDYPTPLEGGGYGWAADPSGVFVAKGALAVNVMDYGVKGDGTTDDSAASQAALNAVAPGGRVLFPQGRTFRVVTGLTCSAANVTIVCDGTILADTAEMTVLTVSGDRATVRAKINGNAKAATGVRVTGARCVVEGGLIENLRSVTGGATGVRVETTGGVTVRDNEIRDINAVGDTTTGNSVGASRAVLITASTAATEDNIVQGNRIKNVIGEEGDAIQLLFGTSPFPTGRGFVRGNIIDSVSRRAVKIQAADTVVADNVYRHTGTAPGSPAALIDVIHSNHCVVTGNDLDAAYFLGIQISGPTAKVTGLLVSNNNVVGGTVNSGIYVDQIANSDVKGNVVHNGTAGIWLTGSTEVTVTDNVLRGSSANGSTAIRALSSCAGLVLSRNIGYGGPRDWLIQNDSPGALVEDNHAKFSSGPGGCIRHTSTATGSIYRGNTAPATAAGVYNTSYTDTVVQGARGSAASGSGDWWWTTAIPSTEQPNTLHKRGDVAFALSPAAAGKVGWVCVSAGTPGTWKAFGAIDA